MSGSASKVSHETRAVTVRLANRTQVVDLAALQQFPRVTLPNFEQSGSHGGARTWSGASLRDVVLAVDPAYCSPANNQSRLRVRSEDGWTVYIKWIQVCGVPAGGEALFDVKGCSMCHGPAGEGVTQGSKPAPALRNRHLDFGQAFARLQAGGDQHGSPAFTPSQLAEVELKQILGWLDGEAPSPGGYVLPENRRLILLAYEEGGRPITGKEGLIQLVVAMDDFVGRLSHWVSDIDMQ